MGIYSMCAISYIRGTMPTLNIYVNEELYKYLAEQGKATTVGKQWIEERYAEECNAGDN